MIYDSHAWWVTGGRFGMALQFFLYKKYSSKQFILSCTSIDVTYRDAVLSLFSCLLMSSNYQTQMVR